MGSSGSIKLLEASALEARTQELGRLLFQLARREHAHLTHLNRWTKQLMGWCLSDQQVKNRVLGFLDVLPSLRTSRAIVRHVCEYFPTGQLRLPSILRLGVSLSRPGLLTATAVAVAVRQLVEHVARQFIAGTTTADAVTIAQRLASQGLLVSFDVLGEQVVSEQEAQGYADRYLALLDALSEAARQQDDSGNGLDVHVSIKPSALTAQFDPLDVEGSLERALARLCPIASRAIVLGASLTLDMEQYELRDLTLELTKRLLLQPEVGERLKLGIVIQAYLRDAEQLTRELIEWLGAHDRTLSIRLVKGAYWDSEVAYATQRGWSIPVYLDKWQTDGAFERLTERLLLASPTVRTAIASHNLRSIAHAMVVAEALGFRKDDVEFQLLYGMGEAIQGALHEAGYPVRLYTPVGELIPGMAYLVRRVLENTANESFLRQDLWEHATVEELLRPPTSVTADEPTVDLPQTRA